MGGKTLEVGLIAARMFLEFSKYSRTLMLNISVEKKQSNRTGFNCIWFMTCGVGQRKACSCHNYMLHLCRAMKKYKIILLPQCNQKLIIPINLYLSLDNIHTHLKTLFMVCGIISNKEGIKMTLLITLAGIRH